MRFETINVTPLIDVMLVLLILFMAVVPVAPRSLEAGLPQPRADVGPPPRTLVLTVGPSDYALNGQPVVDARDLDARLRDAFRAGVPRIVLVAPQGEPSYGRVVEAMDVATAAGVERLGLLPRPSR